MSEEKGYYKNYPGADETTENQPQETEPALVNPYSVHSVPAEPAHNEAPETGSYVFHREAPDQEQQSGVNFVIPPQQPSAKPTDYGNPYVASAPQTPQTPPVQPNVQRPSYRVTGDDKNNSGWGKKLLITLGSLVAVAVIALASIGAYTLIAGDGNDAAAVTQPQQQTVANQVASSGNALTVAEIASKVSPSVVSIVVDTTASNYFGMQQAVQGSGTGVIMSADGYILTNAHVVQGASAIKVTLADGTEYEAKLVGADSQSDVGVIKVDAQGLPAVEFGDSDTLQVGDDVVIIGNPLGTELTGTVSDGIVSYLDRELTIDGTTYHYIQTNAGINSGNSGGPLVNSEGLVVGINSAKVDSSMAEGIGFALPINNVLTVAQDLIDNGYVSGRPMIGIYGQDVDEQTASYYQVPVGAYITGIQSGSPAEKAGLQEKDIVTAVNGQEITGMAGLNNEKNSYAPGDKITLTIYRLTTGEEMEVSITLGEQTN